MTYDTTGAKEKKIWDNINKLGGRITDKEKKCVLYTTENKQILNTRETEHEIERYWTKIYRKHQNEIDKVWNKERKWIYQELIEKHMKEQGHAIHENTIFPMVLREHLDSDIYIKRNIVPMNYPVITNKELVKKDGKKEQSNRS